ncbi:carbamate kinase [Labrys monachus]|uniref:Carbamate kinase n=1 Tax=Labrys monachus TaxID=217067 RepID=A0ABU0F9S3_9HYPH|nr:carbamate kinase [Labrys monachus]MDQ0391082.1 carbamate kinase [Labrys monachus]
MRLVVALGGNALLRRGEPLTVENQRVNVRKAAQALADLVAQGHTLVITHGNGPQVGMLALQASAGPSDGAYPLDVLGAESEGMIGYMIEQELDNVLPADALVATLLTQTRVSADDEAFAHPTKPIGPVYDEATAKKLAEDRGWSVAADGKGWRRVVPSPQPVEILEARVIAMLSARQVTVICAGGGGIPVIRAPDGSFRGAEAVIDKDMTSALLARQLDADMLVMLTDVDAVYLDWGGRSPRRIRNAAPSALSPSDFAAGSMGPKIAAANSFAAATRRPAAIGRLEDLSGIVAGACGTRIDARVEGIVEQAAGPLQAASPG